MTDTDKGQLSEQEALKLFEEQFKPEDTNTLNRIADSVDELKPVESKDPPADEAEPTPEQKEEKAASEHKEEVPADKTKDPLSWINDVSDEDLRAKVADLVKAKNQAEHRFSSENGRVIASNARIMQLQRALEEAKAAQAPKEKDPPQEAPAALEVPTPDSPEWANLVEGDPVMAKAVRDQMNEMAKKFNEELNKRVKAATDPITKHQSDQVLQQETAYYAREQELLYQAVPNFVDVVTSPEYDYWKNNVATPAWRRLSESSSDHQTAIDVLRKFQEDGLNLKFGRFAEYKQEEAKAPADTSEADRIAKERAEKLAKSAVAKGSSPTPVGYGDMNKKEVSEEEATKLFNSVWAAKQT